MAKQSIDTPVTKNNGRNPSSGEMKIEKFPETQKMVKPSGKGEIDSPAPKKGYC